MVVERALFDTSELMGKLLDALKDAGYTGHDLERFLVRLLFCLFAWLTRLFEVLNIPEERRRKHLDELDVWSRDEVTRVDSED
jgi:hypothetical protein